MLGNLTSYLTEKDWEEITKRIEACVERVLERHESPGDKKQPLSFIYTSFTP